MSNITFLEALSVLSKSSPFSVKTLTQREPDEYDEYKAWLYIEQDIERDFVKRLNEAGPESILFLCGSSGDGKSEILTRAARRFGDSVRFHLDATHSFQPHQSAIDALDQLFSQASAQAIPLAVGINIGLLGNYVQEGSDEHASIKVAMQRFLDGAKDNERFSFFDFESYPKFRFTKEGETYADFALEIMHRLTQPTDDNPFFRSAAAWRDSHGDPKLIANYQLLSMDGVQRHIVKSLVKVRLLKDQFMTSRTLLDFLFHLLTGPGYLFENLFNSSGSELSERIAEFDPSLLRTKALDQFVLQYELGLIEDECHAFVASLAQWGIRFNTSCGAHAEALIQLFYVAQESDLGNNFHKKFSAEFSDEALHRYARLWHLHREFDGSAEMRAEIRKNYQNFLVAGIVRYANRNAPELPRGAILLGEFNGVKVGAEVDMVPDYTRLSSSAGKNSLSKFNVSIRIGEKDLQTFPVNLSLLQLLQRLNEGYRPNKYDKNAIVLLEAVVERLRDIAKTSHRLTLVQNGKRTTARYLDEQIEISGEV
ncbi:DNA phosphorothioation-dependent restriction protein DptF [Herbaspirillum sp. WGmk3]|uniref:DNA phosphorothioation-dependent restriction protein DptF n=1 Tax=Herbaspirillum sp. WGmk3 TaxID=2919925 RepID=UPI002091305A|nr:DNA phosphorothioation-dependent restriction protein DptF [Herbaspirillum sp. WGmk3]MCO4856065.1 DNA phosphorothioation-dependent restriction protein DptF [Herbaspirillum sp. WGmk3]